MITSLGFRIYNAAYYDGGYARGGFHAPCATRMLAMIGDIKLVQEWIGHRDITTTARVYAKVLIGQKINGVTALEAYRTAA